ncbi:MAG: hypothetical protein Q9186_005364, partial [Xanthomendoza sp. 1 TL-2023]
KPIPTIIATQDEQLHRVLKKLITPIYSMSNLVSFEPYIDKTINAFITQLDRRFVHTGGTCALDKRLQMFAFDVMGEVTFSKPELEYIPTAAYYGYQNNYIFNAPTDGYNYATIAAVLVAPLYSRHCLHFLSKHERTPPPPPLINPNWLSSPTDQAVAIAGYKRARALFESSAMKPVLIDPEYFPGPGMKTDAQILENIKKGFSTVFHASCTCKMGKAGDTSAVLDNRARVKGVKGLRVVDASSFPLLPPGHPVATVYALAEKIADDVKKGGT